ncbi:MAG: alpha/beta fold hydrolase, partial [Bacteroidota bacterium]
ANPASAIIRIPFLRLKSAATNPIAPVFYLEGGPGASSTWIADNPRALDNWAPLVKLGDVVFFDQRGTGAAAERLTWINFAPLPEDVLVSEAAAVEHYQAMVAPAQEAWRKAGVDIKGYTTMESAKDIDELRQAMGLEKISIIGFSYGTHLGQAYMKYFGKHLDKAILVGTEGLAENFKLPLRMDAQFRKLSAMVAADGAVNKDIPDLMALYQRVSEKLSKVPVTLSLTSPLTGEAMAMKVGKFGLDHILFRDLGDASDLPVIPRLLYDIDHGDYSAFTWFVQKRLGGFFGLYAMSANMDIASGLSAERLATIIRQSKESMFGNVLNTPYLALRETWNALDLGADFRADFTSNVPTLLL